MSRKISQAGISLIKSFEGCQLTAYKPVATETYYTIGWGHYGSDVKAGMTITQAQADAMFLSDIVRYENPVNDLNLQLNQNQFDALVSFCYNCGAGNLRKLCLGRTIEQIAASLPEYNKSSGTVLAGLTRRRAAELALFNTPDTKEEEDMTLSNYQWGVLETNVSKLLSNKTITDAAWLDKVKQRTLTVSELSWLTFVVSIR
ncbi:GH24 family phage-related lysozyme (muramidase) [Paenibacillus cellulosilyticus]|uniref:Lysozyme n=1 Tax=Paenibacillus cellulosilyticus TaxID=375489 RepID=A0A2V2YZX5_9BACL|nr:lysozyme [Paenibacillus cellulosilyticus]PWW06345.1 GH24 family phage-related lysozyme (muramidase) [Paenibacillus cellulosilyticus]QKS43439.1 lysozyme [Paenibacillus cellulosilyticus]QKS46303.1 lysozyme [Paenibacillus cellulosilyticus]